MAGLLVLLVLGGCGQGGTAGPGAAPRLTITAFAPLTVQGHHFRPGETVVLRARPQQAGLRPVRTRVLARPDGAFVARMRGYGLDRCTGVIVTAAGSAGSRAIVRSPRYACPPAPPP